MRKELTQQYYRRLYGPSLAERLKYAWVTIGADDSQPEGGKGGTPVEIGPGGKIRKGPAALKGKAVGSLGKSKPKQPAKPKAKPAAPAKKRTPKAGTISIQQASNELADMGYRLIPKPVRQDLKAGKTWYAIVSPDGTTKAMTAGEIAEFVRSEREWTQRAVDTIKEALAAKETIKERFARIWREEPLRYSKWVTIGSNKNAPAGQRGGTPVELDESGNIIKGPGHLEGKHVGELHQKRFFDTGTRGRQKRLGFGEPDEPQPGRVSGEERRRWGDAVEVKPDGRVVGTAQLKADQIVADPERFQFKVSGITDEGVTEELKEVKRFRPEFAGQLLVWRDPEDGKTYVVNGHHRYELAKRTGYEGKLPVFAVDARSAAEARALGALANIAEGRGTAVDAAKFLRDTGLGIDDIREHGISLRGKVAEQGATLSKLSDKLFRNLIDEDLRESRAVAIAKALPDEPNFQDKLASIIDKREAKGRNISDAVVAEMAREMAETPKVRQEHSDLFGSWEEEDSLFVERNDLKALVKNMLSEEKRTFKAVSRRGRDARLEQAGNVLDTERNRQLADAAASEHEIFDRLANSKGPISDAINAAAAELRESPKRRKAIGNRVAAEIRDIIRQAYG